METGVWWGYHFNAGQRAENAGTTHRHGEPCISDGYAAGENALQAYRLRAMP